MATATVKHFSGTTELNAIWMLRNEQFAQQFPGQTAKRADSFSRWVGRAADGSVMPVTRMIDFKANPSLHKCDARCQSAKGRTCECSCGGKYHGHAA